MVSQLAVKDVMTADPITVGPDTSFKEMVDLMIQHDIGAVPVVDETDLVGIVTESDLLAKPAFGDERPSVRSKVRALLHGDGRWLSKASGLTAAETMSAPVLTVAAADPVTLAARRIVEKRIGRLAVMDEGRLVGIVSRRDLLRPFDRPDDDISADIRKALGDRVAFERGHDVTFTVLDGRVTLAGTVTYPREAALVHDMVASIPGVVHVDDDVTASLPEPSPPPLPSDPLTSYDPGI